MDDDRARELLKQERERIEGALAADGTGGPLEGDALQEPGDRDSEDLYLDELSSARRDRLRSELAALERAETRLASGAYGLSIESGEPIPDARLEALPLAERTVAEQQRYRHS